MVSCYSGLQTSSTLAPLIVLYKTLSEAQTFCCILLDCTLALLDFHVKYK